MRIEYDKESDAAYLYVEYPIRKGEVKKTIEITNDIIADFDKRGKLIGIEILRASKILNKKVLLEAKAS